MTTRISDQLAVLRRKLDDPEYPGSGDDSDSLWANVELIEYLDQAHKAFCMRTRCMADTTTFESAYAADDSLTEIDQRIVEIRRGYLQTAGTEIFPVSLWELEQEFFADDYGNTWNADWRTRTGRPQYAVTDVEHNQVRLVPIPTTADTISWFVYRLPDKTLDATTSKFQCDDVWAEKMWVGAMAQAYEKQDAETQDRNRANDFAEQWERVLLDAEAYYKSKRRGGNVVAYGG